MGVQLRKNFGHEPRIAPVEDGVYEVQLVTIGEPKMYPGFNGGAEVEKCRFIFETTKAQDPQYIGKELSMLVNINATGERSWLYKIVKALTGKNPAELGELDLYELCYQKCRVQVVVQVSEDGVDEYANIKDFMALRRVPPTDSAPSAAPATTPRNARREAASPDGMSVKQAGTSMDRAKRAVAGDTGAVAALEEAESRKSSVAIEDIDEKWFES